jgi:trans-aconitate 2-methyltransferase
MTEWNAAEYAKLSSLQATMAAEALSLLDIRGTERVLDVGCGNGKITREIAARVHQGSVVGVDASSTMVAFASSHFDTLVQANLLFEVAEATCLPFREEFDLVVSFNALHWVPEQGAALRSIRSTMKSSGRAHLRLVSAGARKSLETVIEETRRCARWARYFENFRDPYLHLTPEQYGNLAEQNGLSVQNIHTADKAWDFQSRPAFQAFACVTFVAWTQFLPEADRAEFVTDVLDRYQAIASDKPGEENTFKFYQMDVALSRP